MPSNMHTASRLSACTYGEFPMRFNADNVRQVAQRFQLPYPVVADLHGSIMNDQFAPQCGSTIHETFVGNWLGRGALKNSSGYRNGFVTEFHVERGVARGFPAEIAECSVLRSSLLMSAAVTALRRAIFVTTTLAQFPQ
jgi:hypothetical protein